MESAKVRLKVTEALGKDVGPGLCADLAGIGVAIGDIIEVSGKRATLCKAILGQSRKQSRKQLDGLSRENAEVGITVKEKSNERKDILVVDDDDDFRWVAGNLLRSSGYNVLLARDGEEALSLLENDIPELVLLDYKMPGRDGIEIAADMRQRIPAVPIIMITAYAEVKFAVRAMQMGVYDYIAKPIDNDDLIFAVKRALEKQDLEREVERLRNVLNERAALSLYEIMGNSDQIRKLVQLVEKVAPTTFTVLVEGESGSGKEAVAHAIHDMSKRKKGPFIALDCGAIPETLMESELFGYMKGAFTGAHKDKLGQFELADGGTLFLDEVGNLPYSAQQKLLRSMQERVVQRLGDSRVRPVQVRIIAATNRPLEEDIEIRNFRSDLYFRLKEFTVRIPPLRERKEDIPYLAKRFMDEVQGELHKKCLGLSKEALGSLTAYDWPGNVRELRSVIRQAVLLSEENAPIKPDNLMFSPCSMTSARDHAAFDHVYDGKKPLKEVVRSLSDDLEKKIIKEVIAQTKGNKSEAARRLGIDYKTLLRKIKLHQIEQTTNHRSPTNDQ